MRSLVANACLLATCLLALTSCDQENDTAPDATEQPAQAGATATHGHDNRGGPPPFRIRYGDNELVLHPHTYCYGNGCVDGFDPDPVDLGDAEDLRILVPDVFSELEVSLHERTESAGPDGAGEGQCRGRGFVAPVEDLGGGWYRVRPYGPAHAYDVSLFAQGRGDMAAAVRWTTATDGPSPTPSARLALIADHDGRPDSYGLELAVDDLQAADPDATATIEVTAGNGRSLTFAATRADDTCGGDTVFFDGPDARAEEAARLGDFPFTTTVRLTLHGTVHTATATYPDDEIEDNEPSVRLDFDPPLPAWR